MPFNFGIQKYFFHDNHTLINSQSASIFVQIYFNVTISLVNFVHIL